MADTPNGETATPAVLENNANNPGTPTPPAPVKTEDSGEVDKLRKEKEQAEMRANQLANQLKAKEEAEAAAEAKQLEEQNEFKTLYEQSQEKLREKEEAEERRTKEAAVQSSSKTILSEYSDDVAALAEEAGLTLTDDSEEAKTSFKERLDKINTRLGATKVTPNNPAPPNGRKVEFTTEELQQGLADPSQFHKIVTERYPGIAAMTSKRTITE